MRRFDSRSLAYIGLLAAAFGVAVTASWRYGARLDTSAYDYIFQHYQPPTWQPQSVLLAIDERTLDAYGGMPGIRKPLAEGLRIVAKAAPKAVAVDIILANATDPQVDADLAAALRATPNLVLASQLTLADRMWEDPLPIFRGAAVLAHVHSQPDSNDSVVRMIPLEKRYGHDRRWAMALEAFRLSTGTAQILETPADLELRGAVIPIPAKDTAARVLKSPGDGRLMRVRFVPPSMPIPTLSLKRLIDDPSQASQLRGKVVFIGATSQTENDRFFTPFHGSIPTNGIEINANAFETIAQGLFLLDVPYAWELLFAVGVTIAAGLAFRYLPGWQAYAAESVVLIAAMSAPYVFFTYQRVFSFSMALFTAWLTFVTAAAWYHLVARKNWLKERSSRERYQQAMHFVTHEMRTPLSTIQGSSELISRFALTEEKRKQIALMIHSESKRLARLVEIFLNVERLSAGQMELKHENISIKDLLEICVDRVRPLSERKHIGVTLQPVAEELHITGDRELIEHSCYNLLTNAVKYSPQRTQVTASAWQENGHVRIAIEDQGIGLDHKEVKQIFQKFYRTRKAEESGEAGTGIGLSIVQQIVEQHGGEIEVKSHPGAGSCFTLVLPTAAERH